jgi:hypothetical protein
MLEIEFTQNDMNAERLLTPGWYPCRVSSIGVKPKKDKPHENNIVVSFDVIGGSDQNGPAEGTNVKDSYFSMAGYALSFFRACTEGEFKPALGMKINLEAFDQAQLDVYIKPGAEYQGRISNEATAFDKLGKQTGK